MYKTKVVNGQTVPDWDYVCFYKGTLSGTTLSNLTLVWSSTGSDQTFGIGDTVDLSYTSGYGEDLYSALSTHLDQDGTLKADSVDVTAVIKDAVITPAKLTSRARLGWFDSELPAVSSVTHNGNRSYTVAFASTVASILSEGMRLEFTKTVAGNGYMGGAFNGSSHYFTKTSPSGTLGTVTNNFTIEAVVQPTAYQNGTIAARADAAGNNTITFKMTASGQIECGVQNAGAANYRSLYSYQSLPLNKKTHVAASWTGGTVVIYFDGVSVPVAAAATGGTAPTTAGTGGDFSIGRKGASATEYFPGYISNVAVFNAVLSAATIREHATYKLTGSETNCIGAWSLDNTANDQNSAANNLTATGGVGYTAMTPHGQLESGVQTTKAVGLVMSVSGTDVVVQTPEGVTIPTTGGITSVSYSTQANPFGWVANDDRWAVDSQYYSAITVKASPTVSTWYNGRHQISVPTGSWSGEYSSYVSITSGGVTYMSASTTLSTSTSTGIARNTSRTPLIAASSGETDAEVFKSFPLTTTTQTLYYWNAMANVAAVTNISFPASTSSGGSYIKLIPSGL